MADREEKNVGEDRRAFLSKYGKLALVAPPAITMMLSTSMSSPAIARSTGGNPKGNNGVGNGPDPQPPGNPKINDGPGTTPGNPGNGGNSGNNGNSGTKSGKK
jgi:hypothetical protein